MRLHRKRDLVEPVEQLVLLAAAHAMPTISPCTHTRAARRTCRCSAPAAHAIHASHQLPPVACPSRRRAHRMRVDEAGHQELAAAERDELRARVREAVRGEHVLQRVRRDVRLEPRDVAIGRDGEQAARQRTERAQVGRVDDRAVVESREVVCGHGWGWARLGGGACTFRGRFRAARYAEAVRPMRAHSCGVRRWAMLV